jgi:hypothetical protein
MLSHKTQSLRVFFHRQFVRVFVLSIGEACREATTAPVSGGAWWRSPASGARSKTRQRTGGRSGLPWPGQDLGLRAARRASGGAWWRSPASGARSKTRQRTGGRSGLPWPGQDLGLRSARRASGGAWWRSPASGARSKTRQRTGGRSGLLWPGQDLGLRARPSPAAVSFSRWPATRHVSGSARWRSPASGARSKTRQRTGSRSGLPWPGQGVGLLAVVLSYRQFVRVFVLSIGEACREATTAPASGSARWRSPASGARSKTRQRTGSRSGLLWPGQALLARRQTGVAVVKGVQFVGQLVLGFVLSIGEACHEAMTAPASGSARWRSPASGARWNVRQRIGSRSGWPSRGQRAGLLAGSGCRREDGIGRQPVGPPSMTGSASGSSSSRLGKPATRR